MIALLVMGNFPKNATRSHVNVLPASLKLIDDRSIVDKDILVAMPLVKIASRNNELGLAVGETAIAYVSKGVLPINNGFGSVPIQVGVNANETE